MGFIDFWMNNLAEDRVYILEHFETQNLAEVKAINSVEFANLRSSLWLLAYHQSDPREDSGIVITPLRAKTLAIIKGLY